MNYSLRALKKRVFMPNVVINLNTLCKFSAHQIDSIAMPPCSHVRCHYCVSLPSGENRMFCTLAITAGNVYNFEGLEAER